VRIRREVSYQWRLREVMATRGLFATTELVPLLAERGISLSASQVHRLVTGIPERLSLPVLAALCDILACTPAELIATRAANAAPPRPAPATPWPWSRPGCPSISGPAVPASGRSDRPPPHRLAACPAPAAAARSGWLAAGGVRAAPSPTSSPPPWTMAAAASTPR
jgi:DNA-binding Xre family transcriptional regulator